MNELLQIRPGFYDSDKKKTEAEILKRQLLIAKTKNRPLPSVYDAFTGIVKKSELTPDQTEFSQPFAWLSTQYLLKIDHETFISHLDMRVAVCSTDPERIKTAATAPLSPGADFRAGELVYAQFRFDSDSNYPDHLFITSQLDAAQDSVLGFASSIVLLGHELNGLGLYLYLQAASFPKITSLVFDIAHSHTCSEPNYWTSNLIKQMGYKIARGDERIFEYQHR